MKFGWKGFTSLGVRSEGEIEAPTLEDAAGRLREQKIFVSVLSPSTAVSTPAVPDPAPPVQEQAPVAAPEAPVPPAEAQPSPQSVTVPITTPVTAEVPATPVPEAPVVPERQELPWEKDLRERLRLVADISSFVSEFGIPANIVTDTAKEMIRSAIVGAYRDEVGDGLMGGRRKKD